MSLTNPVHVLAIQLLQQTRVLGDAPGLRQRFERFLAQYAATDPQVVRAVYDAIAGAGYSLDAFEGAGAWSNFRAATTKAIARLQG